MNDLADVIIIIIIWLQIFVKFIVYCKSDLEAGIWHANMALNPLVNTLEKCLRCIERDNFDVYFKAAMKNS